MCKNLQESGGALPEKAVEKRAVSGAGKAAGRYSESGMKSGSGAVETGRPALLRISWHTGQDSSGCGGGAKVALFKLADGVPVVNDVAPLW